MSVTRSWEQVVTAEVGTFTVPIPPARKRELWWLLGSSLLVAVSLLMVCLAKTQNFGELQSRLDRGELLNLNAVTDAEQLLPFLQIYTDEDKRTQVAEAIWSYLQRHKPLLNVGALARVRLLTPDSRLPASSPYSSFALPRSSTANSPNGPGSISPLFYSCTLHGAGGDFEATHRSCPRCSCLPDSV